MSDEPGPSKPYSFLRPKIAFTMSDLENDVDESYDTDAEIQGTSKPSKNCDTNLSGKKKKTKTFTKAPNLQEIQAMVETQGLVKETIKKRENAERQYNKWAETFDYKSLDELCEEGCSKEELEFAICSYFDSFMVGKNNDELPSKNYIDTIKSHLKVLIKKKTSNRLDIADNIAFPKLRVSLNQFAEQKTVLK